jgi:hypothetical protein
MVHGQLVIVKVVAYNLVSFQISRMFENKLTLVTVYVLEP